MTKPFPISMLPMGILLVLTMFLPVGPVRAEYLVKIDPAIQYPPFQGWGVSLAWWAHVVGGFPEPARSDYMEKAFDPVKGLGFTIVRYNIGGGENPAHLLPNRQFLQYRAVIPGYEPAPGQWDWNADAAQRWVLQQSIRMGANQLEAFSNSPPYWMTRSGSVTGNEKAADNIKPESYGAYTDYLVRVVKHFHDEWGVNFQTLDPLNEPTGSWALGNFQEGCHVDRPNENTIIKAVGAALLNSGLSTRVTASDEQSIDDAVRTFPYYEPATLRSILKINTHSYGGGDRTRLSTLAASAGKTLWLSEYGDIDPSGMKLSQRILEDLNGLHPAAWVCWQLVDSVKGWGFLKNPLKDEIHTAYTINKKYYVMAQYSRFIRPGFRFIAIDDLRSVAAYDLKTRTLVIVTTNAEDANDSATYDLSAFVSSGASITTYRTSPDTDLVSSAPQQLSGNRFSSPLPGMSVTTHVISPVRFAGKMSFDPSGFYQITNQRHRRALSQGNESREGVPARLGNAGPFTAQWRLIGLGGDLFKIVNRNNGLLLDGRDAEPHNGAAVDLHHDKNEAAGSSRQQWHVVAGSDGTFEIINASSKLALEGGARPDSDVQQSDLKKSPGEQWHIVKTSTE